MASKFNFPRENAEAEFQLRGCYITYCHTLRSHFFIKTYKEFIFFLMNYVEDVMKPILIDVNSDADPDKPVEFLGIDHSPVLTAKEEPKTLENETTMTTTEIVEVDSPLTSSEYFCIKEEDRSKDPENGSLNVSVAPTLDESRGEVSIVEHEASSMEHRNSNDTTGTSLNESISSNTTIKSEELDSDMEIISELVLRPIKSDPIYVIRPIVGESTEEDIDRSMLEENSGLNSSVHIDVASESPPTLVSKLRIVDSSCVQNIENPVRIDLDNSSIEIVSQVDSGRAKSPVVIDLVNDPIEIVSEVDSQNAENQLGSDLDNSPMEPSSQGGTQDVENQLGSDLDNSPMEPISQVGPQDVEKQLGSDLDNSSMEPISQGGSQNAENQLGSDLDNSPMEPISQVGPHNAENQLGSDLDNSSMEPISQVSSQNAENQLGSDLDNSPREPISQVGPHNAENQLGSDLDNSSMEPISQVSSQNAENQLGSDLDNSPMEPISQVGPQDVENQLGSDLSNSPMEPSSQGGSQNVENQLRSDLDNSSMEPSSQGGSQDAENQLGSALDNSSMEPISQGGSQNAENQLGSDLDKSPNEAGSQTQPDSRNVENSLRDSSSKEACFQSNSNDLEESGSNTVSTSRVIETNSQSDSNHDLKLPLDQGKCPSESSIACESDFRQIEEFDIFEPPLIVSHHFGSKTVVSEFDMNKKWPCSPGNFGTDVESVKELVISTDKPASAEPGTSYDYDDQRLIDEASVLQPNCESNFLLKSNDNPEKSDDNNLIIALSDEVERRSMPLYDETQRVQEPPEEDSKVVFGNLFMNLASFTANMPVPGSLSEPNNEEEVLESKPEEMEVVESKPEEMEVVEKKPVEAAVVKPKYLMKTVSVIVDRLQPPGKGMKFCVCEECGRLFRYKNHLIYHKGTHMKEKPFACQLCPRRYSAGQALTQHMRRDHDQVAKRVVCDFPGCSYFAYSQRRLDCHKQSVHKILIENLELHKCQYCDETFVHKNTKAIHERVIHTGERPYTCQACGRKFHDNSVLRRHRMRMHSTQHRVQCPCCTKRFFGTCDLRRHMDMHTDTRSFGCKVCGKAFVQKPHLQKHLRGVHNLDA